LNAGFNWQSGRWIYGFEGDAVFTSIKSSNANSVCFCFPAETEITHILSFRGRVGYLVMPNTLVFVSGGIAAANMKFGIVGLQTGSAVEAGPAVGAGIEVQVLATGR
jgi:outer membrane immunogenic protein